MNGRSKHGPMYHDYELSVVSKQETPVHEKKNVKEKITHSLFA